MGNDFSTLQTNILETLSYFDLFDYPLTLEQIYLLISFKYVSLPRLYNCLESHSMRQYVDKRGKYYCLKGRAENIIHLPQRYKRAQHLESLAIRTAGLIRHLPFIRGIYISGDLSKGVSSQTSDIDFFIITAARRLYIAKLFLALFRRIPIFNPQKLLCFNYLIDDEHLELDQKNQFVAMEIAYLGMLYNQLLYDKFLNANKWVKSYAPRYQFIRAGIHGLAFSHSRLQSFIEFVFNHAAGEYFDRLLMNLWRLAWSIKYVHKRSIRNLLLCGTQRSFCKAHGFKRDVIILDEYNKRLKALGLKGMA